MSDHVVGSTEGAQVAVHELGGGSDLPPLLISHATGFHAHCYEEIARQLVDRYHVVGLDYRGHGETAVDPEWEVDWRRFGDDAVAVVDWLDRRHDDPVVGFGHSMGGAALLMAAHRRPDRFERLVLFEPISHQATDPPLTTEQIRDFPIVQGALRRRRRFGSFDDAHDNYKDKPPMSLMTPSTLRSYVDHGFRPVDDDGPAVELRCAPELEAGIFVTGVRNGVWDLLPEIDTPCVVVGGRVEERQPSAQTAAIAERLPNGRYVLLDHQSHFGPFSHPAEIASLIAS